MKEGLRKFRVKIVMEADFQSNDLDGAASKARSILLPKEYVEDSFQVVMEESHEIDRNGERINVQKSK